MDAGQAQSNTGLPPGISFEDAEKIAQGDMGAIVAVVARFKANHILPHQPAFIAFFAELPDDAWLGLRQAMVSAKVPIRDVDKKVKAKRDEDARPRFDPSTIDADNSYPPFTMTSRGLFKATKQGQCRVCVVFEVVGLMRRALDRASPRLGRRAGAF